MFYNFLMQIPIDEYFIHIALPIITNPEYQSMKKYVAHGSYSVYDHSIRVAVLAYCMCRQNRWKVDYESLIIGCLLHDFYLYDWHHAHEGHKLHGFRHPFIALMKAKKVYKLNSKVCNMIRSHMFPLTFWTIPLSKEAWILTLADKISATMEHKTIKSMKKLEKINEELENSKKEETPVLEETAL